MSAGELVRRTWLWSGGLAVSLACRGVAKIHFSAAVLPSPIRLIRSHRCSLVTSTHVVRVQDGPRGARNDKMLLVEGMIEAARILRERGILSEEQKGELRFIEVLFLRLQGGNLDSVLNTIASELAGNFPGGLSRFGLSNRKPVSRIVQTSDDEALVEDQALQRIRNAYEGAWLPEHDMVGAMTD